MLEILPRLFFFFFNTYILLKKMFKAVLANLLCCSELLVIPGHLQRSFAVSLLIS